mgnify:CR=1 FL=1
MAEGGFEYFADKENQFDSYPSDVSDGVFDIEQDIEISGISYGKIQLGYSTHEIDNIFIEIRQWTITIALIMVILVAVFSYFLGNYLTMQINKINAAAEIISKKGPGFQIAVEGNDEIATMSKAFNNMSLSLKDSYEQLEQGLAIQNDLLISASENESKIQAILESSLDALIIIDQNGIIEEFNPQAEEIFGWRRDDVFGKPVAGFIVPEEQRKAHTRGMDHYNKTGEGPIIGKRLELNALHRDGHEFPVELTISNIKIDQKELFAAFIRDISDRKATETELRLSARAFDSIEAMFITDSQGRIIRTNKAFTRITGYTQSEATGQNPRDFLKSGLHKKPFYDAMWQQIRLNGHWRGEIYNRRKNGEVFPENLSISAVYDENGKRSHFIAHFTDITDQKQNEEKLLKARNQADQANEAKSRFLATMSHEIRTPLGAVLGILDMLKQTELSQEQSNLVKTGEHSGKQLLEIINTILDFSRMKAGKLKITSHPLRLHELFNTTKEMLVTQAENKGLDLKLSLVPEIPEYARGDATRIRQILINLINNAIKFTDQGSITVNTSFQQVDQDKFILTTEVIDTGIGISDEFQKVLFEEFTMSDESHARKQEGSGLGLAISNQLAKLMNGALRFKANDDKGSTFEFDVELEFETEANVIAYEHQFKPKTVVTNRNINVLVAEDNPANRMIFGNYLDSAGIKNVFAKNGIEALEAFKKDTFDIVLMDISMPLMDGITATHEIRKLDKKDIPTPIIALTAHTMEEEIKRYMAEGMNDHLAKPCNKESMLSCIQKWTTSEDSAVLDIQAPMEAEQPPEEDQIVQDNNEAEIVDNKVIQQLIRDTSEEIVPELLEFYIEESKKLVSNIKEAQANNDAEALEFHSHTLGSSSGAHAAMQLHLLARKIEHLCRDGNPDKGFELIDELVQLADESFTALADVAKNMASNSS